MKKKIVIKLLLIIILFTILIYNNFIFNNKYALYIKLKVKDEVELVSKLNLPRYYLLNKKKLLIRFELNSENHYMMSYFKNRYKVYNKDNLLSYYNIGDYIVNFSENKKMLLQIDDNIELTSVNFLLFFKNNEKHSMKVNYIDKETQDVLYTLNVILVFNYINNFINFNEIFYDLFDRFKIINMYEE